MSIILCESTIDMDKKKLEKLGAVVLPFPYKVDGQEQKYEMKSNFDFKKFYEQTVNQDVSVCLQNITYFIELIEPYLKNGNDIIYISCSSRLNPSFNNLKNALNYLKNQYPDRNIYFVDTMSISTGAGSLVYGALKLHNNGATDEEVVRYVKNNRKNFSAYCVISDTTKIINTDFIENINQLKESKMVAVRPIFTINEKGQISLVSRPIGMKKALSILVNKLKQFGQNVNDYKIYIMHSDSLEDANYLCEKVREYVGYEADIEIRQIGPIVGMYCKKGTVGIVFHSK